MDITRTTIAVGVDGSEPSLIALRWALNAAAVRDAELLVVIAQPAGLDRSGHSGRSTRQRNADIREHIVATCGSAPVRVEELTGTPTEVLLAVSKRVDLLVVGGHGWGGWRDHFTPSLTGQLAVRTKAAVCVVRAIAEPVRNRIVVGYDARSGSAAVEFALAEAVTRDASMLIVSTWHYARDTTATSAESIDILEHGAAAALLELAVELRHWHPDVAIDTVVRFGYPAEVLAELANSADMVVIGSQRHSGLLNSGFLNGRLAPSGLATLVVGSVAIGILRRVPTPVVIVPLAG